MAKSSGVIEHRGNSVKSESVKSINVNPHTQIREEKTENLPVVVVEETRVPERVITAWPGMEVAGVRPVKHVEAILGVLACVRVDHIEHDEYAHSVG